MLAELATTAGRTRNVLVGPETGDDAGVYLHGSSALVATVDFITPVCDDPARFGRVAAANSLSDVFAMGGEPLFALNLCCFPSRVPAEACAQILSGAKRAMDECGAALLGGHTVADSELKFGLSVVGHVDPQRMLTLARARPGDRLVLTKPLGTGVVINAFKTDKLDERALEPALLEMERLNDVAARLALEHRAHAATDITGFGLAGHALNIARGSAVALEIEFAALPVHEAFYEGVSRGVSTGSTRPNRRNSEPSLQMDRELSDAQRELLFDPQTSGGLLVTLPAAQSASYLAALRDAGHGAQLVGLVVEGPPKLVIR